MSIIHHDELPLRRVYTTSEFASIRNGFQNCCGPTAITNLILMYRSDLDPKETFETVARIGSRRLAYVNLNVLGFVGGTSDLLTGRYLRACLNRFGLSSLKIGRRQRFRPENAARELEKGNLLYVQVSRHPIYGYHHMLVTGVKREAYRLKYYFRTADGWNRREIMLTDGEFKNSWFIPVGL